LFHLNADLVKFLAAGHFHISATAISAKEKRAFDCAAYLRLA
jgi:hypothetical protein